MQITEIGLKIGNIGNNRADSPGGISGNCMSASNSPGLLRLLADGPPVYGKP